MEESMKRAKNEGVDKEILYSKAIKAGKRIYYLDVKKNLKNDLFLAITESKKIHPKGDAQPTFEKHKIFLYKEDFAKFIEGLGDVISYIKQNNESLKSQGNVPSELIDGENEKEDVISLTIEF